MERMHICLFWKGISERCYKVKAGIRLRKLTAGWGNCSSSFSTGERQKGIWKCRGGDS